MENLGFTQGTNFVFNGDRMVYEVRNIETKNNIVFVYYTPENNRQAKKQVFKPAYMKNEYKFV